MKVWVVAVVSQSVGRRWWLAHPSKLTTHLRIAFTCSELIPSLSNKEIMYTVVVSQTTLGGLRLLACLLKFAKII